MKTLFKYAYVMVLAAVAVVMAACSSDSTDAEVPELTNEADLLQLRIATSANVTTRTRTTWTDDNAQDEEMMNLWVVVVTNTSDGIVQKCFACRPSAGTEREIDEVGRIIKGEYTVYSFANISVTNVCTLLGLMAPNPIPTIGSTPVELAVTGSVNAETIAARTATINGNNFNPNATNNYDETGIPMSNVQTTADTETSKDLIVVRMLAKMQISITNETGASATVQSLTISDVTSNAANNLKLLPRWTNTDTEGKDKMNVTEHGGLQPNTNSGTTVADFTVTVNKTINNKATEVISFYINESATPSNGEGLFYLTLKMSNTEYRYALISSQSSDETAANYKWNYIARNDYRIIPIVLDDYKLELIPYDFPPIGVYPASVREIESDLYEMTFHDYGHFHLVPKVTKMSNNTTVPYSATEPSGTAWTLRSATTEPAKTAWENSFFTAATKGGAWVEGGNPDIDENENVTDYFYRNLIVTIDGDEAGGVPVWYANTSSPQWDPAGDTTYNPFIFGYIADPGDTWWGLDPSNRGDRQVYHEMRVKLYVDGTYRRDLLYRFYMTLSASQMLGARAITQMPRKRH
jgi:hypothetical protein